MSLNKRLFLDTETTSLVPGQIAQLAFIVENNGKVEKAENYFFTVNSIDEGAYKVHGMSVDWLKEKSNGKKFKDLYNSFYSELVDSEIIGHNVKFDERFISSELWREGISFRPKEKRCTMEKFKNIMKLPSYNRQHGKYKYPNLGEVVRYLNINDKTLLDYTKYLFGGGDVSFHDARFDTTAVYVVTKVHEEMTNGGNNWRSVFCK